MNCTNLRKKQLNGFGFIEKDNPNFPSGEFFYLNENYGKGGYWLYDYKNLFAISIHDFSFFNDFYFSTNMYLDKDPKYLSISHNINIKGDFLNSNISPHSNSINGFSYGEDKIEALIEKNTKVYSISIEIYEEYYEYLTNRFNLEKDYLKNALLSFQNDSSFYEMMILLMEVQNFKSSGISAELFYESKVTEAVSLILAKAENNKNFNNREYIEILKINNYILENLDRNISQDELCNNFFMGRTKLQTEFKKVNNLTITDFVKVNRMEKAKLLLKDDNLTVKDISKKLGYTNQSRFSELFKEYTNVLPKDYKNLF